MFLLHLSYYYLASWTKGHHRGRFCVVNFQVMGGFFHFPMFRRFTVFRRRSVVHRVDNSARVINGSSGNGIRVFARFRRFFSGNHLYHRVGDQYQLVDRRRFQVG